MLIDKLFKPKEHGKQDYYEIEHFEYNGNKNAALIKGNDRNNIVLQKVVKGDDKRTFRSLRKQRGVFRRSINF